MWEDPDPGGTGMKGPSPQELSELKDQNEQQLVLIAQLKEMLRKEQSSVSQDKVEEYVNTLNRARAKRSKLKKSESSSSTSKTTTSVNIAANKKERVNLLRQQLEENKARLAERGKSQKGIEAMVTQMQAQLKDSQTLISSTPLNVSVVESKSLDYNESTPQKELFNILLTKEKNITDLSNKSQKLESAVLDLQENLKEKDSVIDARTKAITLMTDSLSKKGKNTLDALEETKDQMRKMQENFITLEAEMKARQLTLLNDLKVKNFEISELQEINAQLENEKSELNNRLLLERPPSPVNTPESSIVANLRKEIEQLSLENKKLLEKVEIADKFDHSAHEDLYNKYQEVSQEKTDIISKITQLQLQLEEASAASPQEFNEIAQSHLTEKIESLTEENQKLSTNNSEHLLRIQELEKRLEEALLRINNFEQTVVDSPHEENKKILEENDRLSKENADYSAKIQELEKQLEGALTDLKLLKNTGMGSSTKPNNQENEEFTKLKKQLDESNKNMIKMRAAQKGKIKELNKRLDQFKKMNDANALIVQLQNEIGKLNEKVAELEDEKGNLQLKMVDSTTSSKEDSTELEEEIKQLKEKVNRTELELMEKEKVIQFLESDVLSLKADLKQKSEEEIKISTQVSSEMSSICYEEQIEMLESEKKKLLDQLNVLNNEKDNLLEELDLIKKEKHDLNFKLESYIQENMELIDKLEKLSAEKVSSAESIEIVEGLTQQEKLELAAYQKHINPEEPLKCPDEDNIEPPAELNESVLQLSEDTAELLQKIEMFTQERKEVMQKMETMKEENNMLILKVKEIENNRDILEETYEQLQNEKDALQNEKQELSDKLDKVQIGDKFEENESESANILDSELKTLQIKYEALIQENDELKRTLKEFDSIMQEKYDLEGRLRDVVENNTSLDTKLNSNLDEINAYQLTIEENKTELVNSADIINKLQNQVEERENDIQELHINLNELNSVINELQGKQSNFETLESELENLKSTLTDQITQAADYESELAHNSDTIKKLNEELLTVSRRIFELENELELKDSEIEKLRKDMNNKDEIIKNLQTEIEKKDRSFKTVNEDIKNKYLDLKEQLDKNDGLLQAEITKLNNKNQEQLGKMKKIAANLKKKSQAYQELEELIKNERQNWEDESKKKNNATEELKKKLIFVTQELEDAENRLKGKLHENRLFQNEIEKLKEELVILEQNNADQQHYIQELKHKQDKLEETSLQQEMSASLHEEIDTSFSKNVVDDKIRELELVLETKESELSHCKDRISRLEEDSRKLQETKSKLEIINSELAEKLNLTSSSFKEKALLEDQLELRLAEVSANDEVLTKKLQETQGEREELLKKSQEYEVLIKRLKIKLKKAHDKVTELQAIQVNMQELELANQELKAQVASLEDNQRHIQSENESLQRRNMSDYEKIEADYQTQLEELLKAKNDSAIDNEKLTEKIKELADKEQELISDLDEYKAKLDQVEKNNLEKITHLEKQIEIGKSDNQKLTRELDEIHIKFQESSMQGDSFKQQLDAAKEQLKNLDLLKAQLDSLSIERGDLKTSLQLANENIDRLVAESDSLKQNLKQSNTELELTSQEVQELKQNSEKLKQEILALEFAKSSLEASYESSQKLENNDFQPPIQPTSLPEFPIQDTSPTKPTFVWSDQSQANPENSEKLNILLKEVNDKFDKSVSEAENLKKQLSASRKEFQLASDEANNLKDEVDRLKQEICALQFAKSSLEASYECSQKPVGPDTLERQVDGIVLEGVSKKIVKSNQVQQSTIPLFNAFTQPVASSVFDSFPTSDDSAWFSQQDATVVPSQVQEPFALNASQSTTNLENNIILDQASFSPIVEDGREALLKKIKTLEFLLYNTDKEKEIALDQCTELVNELTTIIYDKANKSQNQDLQSDLESQILSQENINSLTSDKEVLRRAEYTPIHANYGEQATFVSEEVIQPKKAYLCFDDENPPKKSDQKLTDLNSQIVSEKDIAEASTSKKSLQELEYEKVDESLGEQKQPVLEPMSQPKHAYLCYTKDDKPQSLEAFEENDDGWGWGPEEARLEEEHINTLESIPQVKTLSLETQQLKENIRVLQIERENHLEEIKQLQVKSGKLIKKYKELKAKSDQTTIDRKQDEGGFFDLNETIQEELKAQVSSLEKRLKELSIEHEKDKTERNNLLKRIDVLTSANDRMVEMKEIQDSEIFRWKRKHQEAVEKLQGYEWGSDGFDVAETHATDTLPTNMPSSLNSRIKELEDAIKDLTLDNEELQTLLEEETAKRLESEKNKSSGNQEELAEIIALNEALHKELETAKLKTTELQTQINQLLEEKDKIIQEKVALENSIQDKENMMRNLQGNLEQEGSQNSSEISNLKDEIASQQNLLEERHLIIEDLQNNLEQLTHRKSELDILVAELRHDISIKVETIQQLQSNLEQSIANNLETQKLQSHVEQLNSVLSERDNTIVDLNNEMEQLKIEKVAIESNQHELNNKLQLSEEQLQRMTAEREQRDLEYQTTLQHLQANVSQVQESQSIINDLQGRISEIEAFGTEKNKLDVERQSLIEQLKIKSLELDEKQHLLEELQLKVTQTNQAIIDKDQLLIELDKKSTEIDELKADKLKKDEEIQRILSEVQSKEQEFQERVNTLVTELNENWQVQVEQRGADVAESWKMHLEMVEKDYESIQEKLKANIVEMEEKYNILVNENNELRKNVDQEIRNEIDKMSAFQQQISSLQHTINSLNQTIQDKDKQIEEIQNNLSNYILLESELQTLKSENEEKEKKLASINIIIETTQKQFDEKRQVIEEIVSVLEKRAFSPISYEKEDIVLEFERQLGLGNGKDIEISKLNDLIHDLERISGEKSRELTGLNQVIEDLEKELSVVHEKEAEIVRLNTELNNIQLEKENLAQSLNDIKQEKDNLKLSLEKANQEYDNIQLSLQQNLDDKSQQIINLNQQLVELQESGKNDSNKEIETLNEALTRTKDDYFKLQSSLSECQSQLYEVTQQLNETTQELQTTKESLIQYQQSFSYYEQEINRLKDLLDQREREYNNSLEMLKNNQLADLQRHYDELLSNRDLDINALKGQVQELVNANQSYGERLNEELTLKQQLEEQLREQTQLVDEDTKQLEELKLIIEDQVAKIEDLKKELFDKSNHYDSLIAEMDVGRVPVTRQPMASAASVNPSSDVQRRQYVDDDLSEPVSRAELDLALYMLHQRDVRCEELTVELTQLLEERDTLQLRLSNAIREKEELRRSIAGTSPEVPSTSSSTDVNTTQSKSSAIFLAASGTELAKDSLESEQTLATKLSELKNVGYKKDKTFVDEQEARRFQQLAIMQQHINDASKLPPEAAAKLVDASYTLSRDVQSPSKVLLNWLWGKNPPRANDS